jgi:hypothetical protein
MSSTFTQLTTRVQDQLSDTSAATKTIIEQQLNEAYHEAISVAWVEDQRTYFRLTTANEKRYLLPNGMDKLQSIQLFETQTTWTTDWTTANKLVDSTAAFWASFVWDYVANTTDNTFARITAVDSWTTLTVDADIFASWEWYAIWDWDHNIAREVASENEWDEYNMTSVDFTSNVTTNYFIRRPYIELFPTPVDSNQILVFTYLKEVWDMSATDYTTWTVAINIWSTTVTWTTTTFTAAMVGQWIQSWTDWYKIAGFTSTTVLTLQKPWQDTSITWASYTIWDVPLISKKYHNSLTYRPLRLLYLRRENTKLAAEYKDLWRDAKRDMTRDSSWETMWVAVKLRSIPKINLDSSKDKLVTT